MVSMYKKIPIPDAIGFNIKNKRKELKKMGKKRTIENIIHTELKNKIAFGQSKHEAKQGLQFGESIYKIFSYSTYDTYLKECLQYSSWLKEEKGIEKIDNLQKTEQYAREYLQSRLDSGVSVYTVKMERSALGMLYSHPIDIIMPIRDNKTIKRSREDTVNDKHISRTGKYKDVFDMALAVGTRRSDLENLKKEDFIEKDGLLYVQIFGSKGGRNRISPVRTDMEKEVREILEKSDGGILFAKIPKEIDIHGLRREYAKELYKNILKNPELKEKYLKMYPPRRELKTQKDKNGNSYTKEIKTDNYKDRLGNIYNRDNIYIISQSLGHNRLSVSITHYLK